MTSDHRQPLAASRILPEPSRGRHRSRSILGDDPYISLPSSDDRKHELGMLQICWRYAEDLNEIPQVQPWRPAYCKVGSSKNLSAPDQFVCACSWFHCLGDVCTVPQVFARFSSSKSSKPKCLLKLCKVPVLVFWKTLADWLRVWGEEVRSVKTLEL